MPSVSFHTLGCKLNFAETGTMKDQLQESGFEAVPFGQAADITVINTCTVTHEADRKCRQVIRKALRANQETIVVVTGCYAQLQPEAITAIPGVDLVLGADEKFKILDYLQSFEKTEKTQVAVSCIDEVQSYGPAYNATDRTRAFLKVQDGCDYSCSFCTIPLARGSSRSATVKQIVDQACDIAERGFKEVILSGVNIGLFGQERDESLLTLVQALDALTPIDRFRISSIEPNLVSNELIDFIAGSRAFQPHFHMPLQSGSNVVLGKMRRRYRREVYEERVTYIKQMLPDACIGADVIVGFPAETEDAFQQTVQFIDALPLSYLHVFTYSERPNTHAVDALATMAPSPVPPAERSRRNQVLTLLGEKKRIAFYQQFLGGTRPVLWESSSKTKTMSGFTDNYIRMQTSYDPERAGTIEPIRVGPVMATGKARVFQENESDLIELPIL